ncbi:MAG: heme oxygenase [Watsoniomyces obsoletus]|nr:MAG: heme oxygenase [Watsoniomyces obsoletus]
MSLIAIEPGINLHKEKKKKQHKPPRPIPTSIVTPCDPWPRPYYFENGFRKVRPYHFTYNTYCKQRWRGRELLDIFVSEFRDRPAEYYKEAILAGRVVVNGHPVINPSTVVKNGDLISHTLHRHEPPVTSQPIRIVHEDNDVIVINKPAGVPVHPTGRYNFNSLIEIMRSERGLDWHPLPVNRLDRLTSGVMFIGKHPAGADAISSQIMDRTVRKEYVARVKGRFPGEEGEEVVCSQPILLISPKLGLNRVRAEGKSAETRFRRVAYYPPPPPPPPPPPRRSRAGNSTTMTGHPTAISPVEPQDPTQKTHFPSNNVEKMDKKEEEEEGYSIVECRPVTGRTHQIRVHLQFLGHPISNDPIYCNQRVFGPNLGFKDDGTKLGWNTKSSSTNGDGGDGGDGSIDNDNLHAPDEDIIARLSRMGKEEVAEAVAYHEEIAGTYEKRKAEKMSGEFCEICDTPLYSEPGLHEMGIYLHARRYACEPAGWAFETELPQWALPPGDVEGQMEAEMDGGGVGSGKEAVMQKASVAAL